MPDPLDARYVVGTPGGARSNVWRVIVKKSGDVYVTSARMGGVEKLSFHKSGICRKAFTAEYGTPHGLDDRATIKWKRSVTPPAGTNQGNFVFEVGIATNTLSLALPLPTKKVRWIAPAPPGDTTVLSMFYARDDEVVIKNGMQRGEILSYTPVAEGEAFVVRSAPFTWDGKDFRVPASHHMSEDYIFSPSDPDRTGRPVRVTIFSHPKDGEKMLAWEHGGYKRRTTVLHAVGTMDTLTRSTVLVRDSDKDRQP